MIYAVVAAPSAVNADSGLSLGWDWKVYALCALALAVVFILEAIARWFR